MNFKCYIVEKYEIVYGKGHFQNETQKLEDLFEKLQIVYSEPSDFIIEIPTEQLFSLKLSNYQLDSDELIFMTNLIKTAKTAKYCKDFGFIRIDWRGQ
ncbi:hypothetical protein CYB86_06390 [Campylobacter coli]|nr:hypothetical protein [Campylobacter coli]EAJ3000638.1 hypothetical protein [Campylobacter coli]EAJ3177435.1 hypothetical protein [Campylobacter coli]EAJ3748150.1 hypothetical protein [Campylobacter coli]EAK2876939.1 hypothetical protein [Campylobacter coli]